MNHYHESAIKEEAAKQRLKLSTTDASERFRMRQRFAEQWRNRPKPEPVEDDPRWWKRPADLIPMYRPPVYIPVLIPAQPYHDPMTPFC